MIQPKVYLKLVKAILDDGMLCLGRVANITHYVLQAVRLPGELVEFGCFTGRSAALIAHVADRRIWLYDSFDGLPDRWTEDVGSLDHFKRGQFKASRSRVEEWFIQNELPPPIIHEGWFNKILPSCLPERICFAHLDGDMYSSIIDSLGLVYHRLVEGGVCVIDDYGWQGTCGVKRAVDKFMADKEKVVSLETGSTSHGYPSRQGVFFKQAP